jgi:ABC-type glycerol-3-phosphate transport system permease component
MTATALQRKRRPLWRRVDGVSYVWFALVGLWALVQFLPVLVVFYNAFRSSAAIIVQPLGIGSYVPSNFSLAWAGPPQAEAFPVYLRNSVEITAIAIFLGVSCGTLSAYGLSRSSGKRWAKTIYAFFIVTIAVPYEIIVIPLYILLNQLHLLNSDIGAGLAYGGLVIPSSAIIMKGFFDTFPSDIIEAARVDGATELRTLWRIVLPLVRGGVIAVLIIGILFVWGDVELSLIILTLPDRVPLAVGLLQLAAQYMTNEGALFAGLAMAILPIVILYLVFQRYVTSSLTLGAVRR